KGSGARHVVAAYTSSRTEQLSVMDTRWQEHRFLVSFPGSAWHLLAPRGRLGRGTSADREQDPDQTVLLLVRRQMVGIRSMEALRQRGNLERKGRRRQGSSAARKGKCASGNI